MPPAGGDTISSPQQPVDARPMLGGQRGSIGVITDENGARGGARPTTTPGQASLPDGADDPMLRGASLSLASATVEELLNLRGEAVHG